MVQGGSVDGLLQVRYNFSRYFFVVFLNNTGAFLGSSRSNPTSVRRDGESS